MALEGAMPVSLRRMAGIPGFGHQAEVSQLELFDKFGFLLQSDEIGPTLESGMYPRQSQ